VSPTGSGRREWWWSEVAYHIPIFISHSWSYPGHYETLVSWIFGNSWNVELIPITFSDVSVPKDNPIHYAPNAEVLKAAIYNRIQAQVVVIPTGMYATHSNWIGKEIAGAKAFQKPILAVNPWSQERKSSVVVAACSKLVGWSKLSVVQGIWDLTLYG
jgi:hypothetical protein